MTKKEPALVRAEPLARQACRGLTAAVARLVWSLDADLWTAPGNDAGDMFRVTPTAEGWTIDASAAALLPAKVPVPFDTAAEARAACESLLRNFPMNEIKNRIPARREKIENPKERSDS